MKKFLSDYENEKYERKRTGVCIYSRVAYS